MQFLTLAHVCGEYRDSGFSVCENENNWSVLSSDLLWFLFRRKTVCWTVLQGEQGEAEAQGGGCTPV